MLFREFLQGEQDPTLVYECEEVFLDENGEEILDEAFIRQLKKSGSNVKKQYRCTSGQKKGKIAADPRACAKRKDPKRKRIGKKAARLKKGMRVVKTKLAKKRAISKLIKRVNKRLSGSSQ